MICVGNSCSAQQHKLQEKTIIIQIQVAVVVSEAPAKATVTGKGEEKGLKAGNFSSCGEKARKRGCARRKRVPGLGLIAAEEEHKRDGVVEGIQVEG
jgi:hypothetical protein